MIYLISPPPCASVDHCVLIKDSFLFIYLFIYLFFIYFTYT